MVDLDAWLSNPTVRSRHCRRASVESAALWDAAKSVRIGESRVLGRLVRWRVPGTWPEETYKEMFTSDPFVVLEEGELHLFAGVCGKIWAARPALATLTDPDEFSDWNVPGTARVLFAQWVTSNGPGAELLSEVRVQPVDRDARLRMRGIWPLIRRFEGLIGTEPLRLAVRRAETRVAH